MEKSEKEVLTRAIESNEGLIPDHIMDIYSGNSNKVVEKLISLGYLKKEERKYIGGTIYLYSVTKKGYDYFLPRKTKILNYIQNDIRTIIISAIIALITTLIANWIGK